MISSTSRPYWEEEIGEHEHTEVCMYKHKYIHRQKDTDVQKDTYTHIFIVSTNSSTPIELKIMEGTPAPEWHMASTLPGGPAHTSHVPGFASPHMSADMCHKTGEKNEMAECPACELTQYGSHHPPENEKKYINRLTFQSDILMAV